MSWQAHLFTLLALFNSLHAIEFVQYEARGYITFIDKNVMDDNLLFEEAQRNSSYLVSQLLGESFHSFFITDLRIHGKSSVIFYAHLTVNSNLIERQQIIDLLHNSEQIQLYYLRANEYPHPTTPYRQIVKDDIHCMNNGVLLPNNTCSCPKYVNGTLCEELRCENGGINDNGKCACATGIYSKNCEPRKCISRIDSVIDFTRQSFIIVINTKISMGFDMSTIINNIPGLIKDYENREVTITNYLIAVYRQKGDNLIMETSAFENFDSFYDYLNNLVIGIGDDDQPHLEAIEAVQSFHPLMTGKSNIYVFADSLYNDILLPSPNLNIDNVENRLVLKTLSWKNKILFMMTQWPGNSVDRSSNDYDVLRRIVKATNGDLVILEKPELEKFLNEIVSYTIGAPTSLAVYNYTKNEVLNYKVNGDSQTASVYILITFENSNDVISVKDNNDKKLDPKASGKFYQIFECQPSVNEVLLISANSMFNARSFINSPEDVLISFSHDSLADNGYPYSFNGAVQYGSIFTTFTDFESIEVSQTFSDGGYYQGPIVSKKRSSDCLFNYQITIDSCELGYYINMVVIKKDGKDYTRAVPSVCVKPDKPVPKGYECLNGGTYDELTNTCHCKNNFSGDHCEQPLCQNKAIVDPFPNGNGHGYCICPLGISGDFCEKIVCTKKSDDVFESYKRSFAVVVQNSFSTAQALQKITDGLNIMLNNGDSDYFEDYVLTTFKYQKRGDTTDAVILSNKYSTAAEFINATSIENIKFSASTNGPQPGYEAIQATIKSLDYDKSSIFFFTDSPSDGYDLNELIKETIDRKIELSIINVAPYGQKSMCNSPDKYSLLARSTGGNFINLCSDYKENGDPILNFVSSYGMSHHHSELVVYSNEEDCSDYKLDEFYISDASSPYAVIYSEKNQQYKVSIEDLTTNKENELQPDSHSVPYFGSYPLKVGPGRYRLHINGDKGDCVVKITERSNRTTNIGFTSSPSIDKLEKDLIYASRYRPVLHTEPSTDDSAQISIKALSKDIDYQSSFTERTSNCLYEYMGDTDYACPDINSSFAMSTLIKSNDIKFQRAQFNYCNSIKTCLNSGTYDEPNDKCKCPIGYTGDYCEEKHCQNGGTLNDYECICSEGYSGEICEYLDCKKWNYMEKHDPMDGDYQQVTFALEVDTSAASFTSFAFLNKVDTIINNLSADNKTRTYTLITFNDTSVDVVTSTIHPQKFIYEAKRLKPNFKSKDEPQKTKALDALLAAYNTMLDMPGTIYLFVSTPQSAMNVKAMKQHYGAQVNVIYTPEDTTSDIDYKLNAVTKQSNGRFIKMSSFDMLSYTNILPNQMVETELVFDRTLDCSQGVKFEVAVDSATSRITFELASESETVEISDGKGNKVEYEKSFSFVGYIVVVVDATKYSAGVWNVKASGKSKCTLQVRELTDLKIFPGFTESRFDDFPSRIPRYGSASKKMSYVTFRVKENGAFSSKINYVNVSEYDFEKPWDLNDVQYSVATRNPNGCSSQFVSDLINWKTYNRIVVRGIDKNQNEFERVYVFAPNDGCANGTPDDWGFCKCDTNYQGDNCDLRVCKHGISAYGMCDCPNGYYGDYCENIFKQ